MEQQEGNKHKLFLGGDRSQQIGWVEVYNGVNVIQYTDRDAVDSMNMIVILPIGNSLKEECFGAFDRTRHKLPY